MSAVGLQLADSSIICGAYLESAAFNPSLNPAQAAIINLIASHHVFEEIEKVVLLECDNVRVSQWETCRQLFAIVNPRASLQRHTVVVGPSSPLKAKI